MMKNIPGLVIGVQLNFQIRDTADQVYVNGNSFLIYAAITTQVQIVTNPDIEKDRSLGLRA